MTRTIKEITRAEWVVFEWLDISSVDSSERKYIRGLNRNPQDAIKAGADYDALMEAITEVDDSSEPIFSLAGIN